MVSSMPPAKMITSMRIFFSGVSSALSLEVTSSALIVASGRMEDFCCISVSRSWLSVASVSIVAWATLGSAPVAVMSSSGPRESCARPTVKSAVLPSSLSFCRVRSSLMPREMTSAVMVSEPSNASQGFPPTGCEPFLDDRKTTVAFDSYCQGIAMSAPTVAAIVTASNASVTGHRRSSARSESSRSMVPLHPRPAGHICDSHPAEPPR